MIKQALLLFVALMLVTLAAIVSLANHHQNKNIQQVLVQNLDGRLIPHKANYPNKLKNIFQDNLRSFEFDTLFNDRASIPYFEIGHDEDETEGVSFENYLRISQNKQLKKIWMDIKNVDENNISAILERLNYLDKKYRIKSILIFETDATTPMMSMISDAGYHTSYYLPKAILQSLLENNAIKLQQEATRIKKQIQSQRLNAISFRLDLYPFVKSYIEEFIPKDIVYHAWGIYQLKKENELLSIQKETYYQDNRIKTIIYSYYNNKLNRLYRF